MICLFISEMLSSTLSTWAITHWIYIVILCNIQNALAECVKDGPCKCKGPGGVIDLSMLPQSRFSQLAKDNYIYDWSPCTAVSCGTLDPTINDVNVCQKTGSQPGAQTLYYCAGRLSTVKFVGDPEKDLKIETECITSGTTRKTVISLVCDSSQEGVFEAIGATGTEQTTYLLTLRSKHACYPSSGLSGGSILLIIFFVLVIIYFVGGALFLIFVRGARGVEIIPNFEFWKDFPFLVRDGVMFLIRGCKADSTYSQI